MTVPASVALTCYRPYAMVGINIIAANSDAEARRLATTQQMSFTNIFRGARGPSQTPIDDIESYWSPAEKTQAMVMPRAPSSARPRQFAQASMRWSRKQAPTSS